MAKRHNQYGQLLGSVENDPQPLVGQMPMSGVPDLEMIANDLESSADWHAGNLRAHASRIRDLAQYQPKFNSAEG